MTATRDGPQRIDDVNANLKMREASGKVCYPASDWLTSLLYEVMRDACPPGELERVVRHIEAEPSDGENVYTNGWLAEYAHNLAERLRAATK